VPENATGASGPSLEQILWRSMDRFREDPAVLDAEEFAEHIAHAFDEVVPEEAFADRFFRADETTHRRPATLAEAVVQRARQRLHVYEFDLNTLEYVIVEDKDKLVVVSEFGQFATPSEDAVRRALEAAVVKASERQGAGPRAWFVRKSGDVVGVDADQVARTLNRLAIRQVSAPAVAEPARRLAFFNPVRNVMSEAREERALRQDPRLSRAAPPARADAPFAATPEEGPALESAGHEDAPSPGAIQRATPAGELLAPLPDGSMTQARIGAAHRFEQMLADRTRLAPRSVTVEAGDVVAVVDGRVPSTPGERALAQGEALAAVRSADAPVRALAGDGVARELVAGGRVVPEAGVDDRYWVRPESTLQPELAEAPRKTLVAAPLELGQITGDPWADWALTVSEGRPTSAMTAAASRGELGAPVPFSAAPPAPRTEVLQLGGTPVVAFRAPDGRLLATQAAEPVRLAALDRPAAPVALRMASGIAPRSGAMPFTALESLRTALERTAAAGAYRLPLGRSEAGLSTVARGIGIRAEDEARAGMQPAPQAVVGPRETERRLVFSMPFADRGELHVGRDLTAALDAVVAAPVVAARTELAAPQLPVGVQQSASHREATPAAHRADVARGRPRRPEVANAATPSEAVQAEALQSARRALLILDLRNVQPLVGSDPSISGVPFLLRRAVAESEGWTLATSVPAGARDVALRAPFSEVQVSPEPAPRLPELRPPELGESEILIPLPLWAQMGRGAVTETDRIMAAPLAPAGYAPPLGAYALVVPGGGPVDLSSSAVPGARIVDVAGPTSVRLEPPPSGTVTATSSGGRYSLAKVPLDEKGSGEKPRGRILIGEPLPRKDLTVLVAKARELRESEASPRLALSPPAVVPAGQDRPSAIDQVEVAAARAAPPASPATAGAPSETRVITGLPPGMWSGHRPASTADYKLWTYGFRHRDQAQSVGGVQLSSFSRPLYPQLPIALRFRFAAAPLWWSARTRAAPSDVEGTSTASGALRAGLRAANTAASLWRSILVAGASQEQVTSTMDAGRDESAMAMSSVARKLEATPMPAVAAGPVPSAPAAAPAYIAMTSSGAAGAVPAAAAARAVGKPVEMSIVAAIPPSPPPLESMSSVPRGGEAPHARVRAQAPRDAQGQVKESEDAVSHSKIEGSVDAIAQRIYHRIRRRIESDRERFGG
jgi:hypothetical protein